MDHLVAKLQQAVAVQQVCHPLERERNTVYSWNRGLNLFPLRVASGNSSMSSETPASSGSPRSNRISCSAALTVVESRGNWRVVIRSFEEWSLSTNAFTNARTSGDRMAPVWWRGGVRTRRTSAGCRPAYLEQHLKSGLMVGIQGGPQSLIDDLGSASCLHGQSEENELDRLYAGWMEINNLLDDPVRPESIDKPVRRELASPIRPARR